MFVPQAEFDQRPEWGAAFMRLAKQCQSVLCCRVTPGQKADIVSLVRKHTSSVTMSIGDGANDVNMIKSKSKNIGKIFGCRSKLKTNCHSLLSVLMFSYLTIVHQRLMLV